MSSLDLWNRQRGGIFPFQKSASAVTPKRETKLVNKSDHQCKTSFLVEGNQSLSDMRRD
jgi:hypothetical protein